jgi:acylphosphatase
MKLYLNLTTDENRKVWPALVMSMYDEVEHIIAHHYQSQPDKGPLIRQAAVQALLPITAGMAKLQDTMLEFHFDGTDNKEGVIDTTIDLFTADLNASRIRDVWVKEMRERGPVHFEDSAGDQHVLNLKDEEIENFIEMADQRVKEISAELWEGVTEQIKSITLRFTCDTTQPITPRFTTAERKAGVHLDASNVRVTLSGPTADAVEELKEKLNKDK